MPANRGFDPWNRSKVSRLENVECSHRNDELHGKGPTHPVVWADSFIAKLSLLGACNYQSPPEQFKFDEPTERAAEWLLRPNNKIKRDL